MFAAVQKGVPYRTVRRRLLAADFTDDTDFINTENTEYTEAIDL